MFEKETEDIHKNIFLRLLEQLKEKEFYKKMREAISDDNIYNYAPILHNHGAEIGIKNPIVIYKKKVDEKSIEKNN